MSLALWYGRKAGVYGNFAAHWQVGGTELPHATMVQVGGPN